MTDVLVTGGAGYIGSHTCKELKRNGFTPIVLDNLATGHREFVRWGPLVEADLRDEVAVHAVFAEFKPIAVIHFAASAYVGESVVDPEKYYVNNVAGSLNLLCAMRAADCRNIVFASSCATYGVPDCIPISTKHKQEPINPYGVSKLTVEKMIGDYVHAYGLNATILRFFNAAGADIEGELGERHQPETHLIPNAIQAAFQNQALRVFGADYDTRDGTCIRDFVHVGDLANAHVLCLQKLLQSNTPEKHVFNLGSETGFSIFEIVAAIESALGRKITVENCPRRSGDPPALIADSKAARKELGWKPKHSTLDTIIDTAVRWSVSEMGDSPADSAVSPMAPHPLDLAKS